MTRAQRLLALCLALLTGTLVVLEEPWSLDRFEESIERRGKPVFPGFVPSQAGRVEIRKGADEVILERGPQGWVVQSLGGYRANEDSVARLLARIQDMTRVDPVTSDPAQHARYRVQESDAVRVQVSDRNGQVLADLLQGRLQIDPDQIQAAGGRISSFDGYVRPTRSPEVYRVSDFNFLEPVRASDWIPRNLFRFDVSAVQTLLLTGTEVPEPIALTRDTKGEWTLEASSDVRLPANRESCETLARSLASVFLHEVVGKYEPAQAAKWGFERPRLQAFVTLATGATEELVVGAKETDEQSFALAASARGFVLRVFESSLAALRATREQVLKPPSPPETAPAPPGDVAPPVDPAVAPTIDPGVAPTVDAPPASAPADAPKPPK